MKKIITLFICLSLLASVPIYAQQRSAVLLTTPSSATDSLRCNAAITSLHTNSEVVQAIKPILFSKNLQVDFFVAHTDGGYTILHYNPKQKTITNIQDQITLRSKGINYLDIEDANQFQALGDTLVLLDTLQINIKFSSEDCQRGQYYFTSGKSIIPAAGMQDALIIAPNSLGTSGVYLHQELHNRANESIVLWNSRLYFLTAAQKSALRAILKTLYTLNQSISNEKTLEIIEEYITFRYGKPVNDQVRQWVNTQLSSINHG